jgi:F0F1-type ATP synthase assembly protein I
MKQAHESNQPVKTAQGVDNSDLLDKAAARQMFIMAATNMSWQLAIVVLVPVIGGYELDKAINSTPVATIIGLFIAMFGAAAVLRRQLQKFGPMPTTPTTKGSK